VGLLFSHNSQDRQRSTGRLRVGLVLFLSLLLLSACSVPNSQTTKTNTRRIVDGAGRTVTVPESITRYVSLAPNVTEIVFAIGAGDGLVGRTTYCNYPAAALKVETVGDTLKPSLERIIALRPQVVFVSTASQLESFTKELDAHDIAVYVSDAHDLEGVFSSIKGIGELLGKQTQAENLLRDLKARAGVVEEKVKPRPVVRVFYQVSDEPLYTIGREAFLTDLIKRAGGVSVTADVPGAWPKYSAESALAARPEAIILPTGGSMGDANSSVAAALKRSPAAVSGHVYKINDDHLSRPGPRSIDGLEELARAIHPEVFEK
jgi:cobalamin transport system substrate-binding protein